MYFTTNIYIDTRGHCDSGMYVMQILQIRAKEMRRRESERERERESVCVCECVCVSERERERECVCVCVYVRACGKKTDKQSEKTGADKYLFRFTRISNLFLPLVSYVRRWQTSFKSTTIRSRLS